MLFRSLEEAIGVTIHFRSEVVQVVSDSDEKNELTRLVLQALLVLVSRGQTVSTPDVVTALTMARNGEINKFIALYEEEITKDSNGKPIRVKTLGQKIYVEDILHHDITFGIGPAGTGKTYLAVVLATTALRRGQVKRIIVTRPAVEAGENLGFLPGDLQEKVFGGRFQKIHASYQRTFPGSRKADDSKNFTRHNFQADIFQRPHVSLAAFKFFSQFFHLYNWIKICHSRLL